MKKLLLITILFTSTVCLSQSSKEYIINKTGDTIKCLIVSVDTVNTNTFIKYLTYDTTDNIYRKREFININDVSVIYCASDQVIQYVKTYNNITKRLNRSAGDFLINSSKTYYTGFFIGIIGTVISVAGLFSKNGLNTAAAGSSMALLGSIISVTAFSDISNAGKTLNKYGTQKPVIQLIKIIPYKK